MILNCSNWKLVIRHFLKDLAPEHGGERMERRRSSLDQCGNKQDHICVHAGAHSQRTCSLPKPCRILKSRGKKGFGNAREVAWILLCTGQMVCAKCNKLMLWAGHLKMPYVASAWANEWSSPSSSIKMCLLITFLVCIACQLLRFGRKLRLRHNQP